MNNYETMAIEAVQAMEQSDICKQIDAVGAEIRQLEIERQLIESQLAKAIHDIDNDAGLSATGEMQKVENEIELRKRMLEHLAPHKDDDIPEKILGIANMLRSTAQQEIKGLNRILWLAFCAVKLARERIERIDTEMRNAYFFLKKQYPSLEEYHLSVSFVSGNERTHRFWDLMRFYKEIAGIPEDEAMPDLETFNKLFSKL